MGSFKIVQGIAGQWDQAQFVERKVIGKISGDTFANKSHLCVAFLHFHNPYLQNRQIFHSRRGMEIELMPDF